MDFNVGDVLPAHYELLTVAASYMVSVLGSFAALYHSQYMFRRDGSIRWLIAGGAGMALGGVGIWDTHFIGMMGYQLPLQVVYDGGLTAISLAAAVLIATIALVLAGGRGRFSYTGWLVGSVLAGAGVCVMHYMGMYSMSLRADMTLEPVTVLVSIGIAMATAAAALWLAFHVVKNSHRIGAALVMGVAVCAVHYTGMSAAEFICVSSKQPPAWALGGDYLPVAVFVVTGSVLVVFCWNILGLIANAKVKVKRTRPVPMRGALAARR
jgi:NO-binding membrane sensor protein with MHYT domain